MDLAYKTCSFRLFLPYNSVMYAYMLLHYAAKTSQK